MKTSKRKMHAQAGMTKTLLIQTSVTKSGKLGDDPACLESLSPDLEKSGQIGKMMSLTMTAMMTTEVDT